MRPLQRWPIVGAVGALVLGAVLLERVPEALAPQLVDVQSQSVRSAVAQPSPLTASWYCAVGSSEPGGYANQVINVSNLAAEPATATVSVMTDKGPGPSVRLELGGYRTQTVDLGTVDSSAAAAAVVEIVGGVGIVSHDVSTEHGLASSPCATAVGSEWYFASGSTRRDSGQFLALLNPFGDDVVLDVTFRTATRERRPEDLSSLVVPGRTVRVIDITEYVSIEAVVATSVTAIQGRVVAEQLQTADGQLGPQGAALVLGTPSPAENWVLPAGRISADGDHQLVIFNPGESQAELELLFDLSTADRRAALGLNPVELSVQPRRFESLDVADLIRALEIPLPLEVGFRVQSANGVPVIVSRTQMHPQVDNSLVGAEDTGATVEVAGGETDPGVESDSGADAEPGTDSGESVVTIDPSTIERRDPLGGSLLRQDDGAGEGEGGEEGEDVSVDDLVPDVETLVLDDTAQPTPTNGIAVTNGSSVPAEAWLVPYSRFVADAGTVLVISADADALVEIRGTLDGDIMEPERVAVKGDTRRVVPITLPVPRTALVLSSNTPIVVEVQTVADGVLTVTQAVPVLRN